LGFDSLSITQFRLAVQAEFNIDISTSELQSANTIAKLSEYVLKKTSNVSSVAAPTSNSPTSNTTLQAAPVAVNAEVTKTNTTSSTLIADKTSNKNVISPTSIIASSCKLGSNISIDHFTIIKDNVQIGDNCTIGSHVVIHEGAIIGSNTRIGEGCVVEKAVLIGNDNFLEYNVRINTASVIGNGNSFYAFTSIRGAPHGITIGNDNTFHTHVAIGQTPQDYRDKPSNIGPILIGNKNVFREYTSVNGPEGKPPSYGRTVIQNNCYFMNGVHIGHDNFICDNVVIACHSQLAGYVRVQPFANIGIGVRVHQFSTIGESSMVAMGSTVVRDVPPYAVFNGKGEQNCVAGINWIGLQRLGKANEDVQALEKWFITRYNTNEKDAASLLSKDMWFSRAFNEFTTARQRNSMMRPVGVNSLFSKK